MKLIETIKPPEVRDTLVNNVQNDDVVVQEFETFLNFFFSRVYFFTMINMSFDYYERLRAYGKFKFIRGTENL